MSAVTTTNFDTIRATFAATATFNAPLFLAIARNTKDAKAQAYYAQQPCNELRAALACNPSLHAEAAQILGMVQGVEPYEPMEAWTYNQTFTKTDRPRIACPVPARSGALRP